MKRGILQLFKAAEKTHKGKRKRSRVLLSTPKTHKGKMTRRVLLSESESEVKDIETGRKKKKKGKKVKKDSGGKSDRERAPDDFDEI